MMCSALLKLKTVKVGVNVSVLLKAFIIEDMLTPFVCIETTFDIRESPAPRYAQCALFQSLLTLSGFFLLHVSCWLSTQPLEMSIRTAKR